MRRVFPPIPALEARAFDSIAAKDAQMQLQEEHLDPQKLQQLQEHPQLLKALDDWTLFPDKRLLPQLLQLATVIQQTYPMRHELVLYRGFSLKLGYQNTMGLKTSWLASPKVKPGEHYQYVLEDSPLSWSTELSIARAFGPVVVRTVINPRQDRALIYTDELAYLVSKARNLAPVTQREVILLPQFHIDFVIEEVR